MPINIQNPASVMIASLEEQCGFNAYAKTRDLNACNIATDKKYQKNYTTYYRVRRDQRWLQNYYNLLEENKNSTTITFEEILRALADIPHKSKNGTTKSVEASFASKMLATIRPEFPIWDSRVIKAMGIKINSTIQDTEEKIKAYVKAYDKLTKEIDDFLKTPDGEACIAVFDKTFPRLTHLSPFKKIDHYLWNMGR